MKISQDIRADSERLAGMEHMSAEFKAHGSALYVEEVAGSPVDPVT
jgi:hypothetical protein